MSFPVTGNSRIARLSTYVKAPIVLSGSIGNIEIACPCPSPVAGSRQPVGMPMLCGNAGYLNAQCGQQFEDVFGIHRFAPARQFCMGEPAMCGHDLTLDFFMP